MIWHASSHSAACPVSPQDLHIFHDSRVPARTLWHGSAYREKRKIGTKKGAPDASGTPRRYPKVTRLVAIGHGTHPLCQRCRPRAGIGSSVVHSIENPSPSTPCKDGTSCIPHDCRMPSCCWRAAIDAVSSACDARALPCGRSHHRWSCGGCRTAWRSVRP